MRYLQQNAIWRSKGGMQIRFVLGVLAGLVGCAMEPSPEIETIERCGKNGCTGNSPIIDHYGFWELNVNGLASTKGSNKVELLGLSQGTLFYDVVVQNSRLIATYPPNPNLNLEGPGLIGAILWVRINGQSSYGITISATGTIQEVVERPPPRKRWRFPFRWGWQLDDLLAGLSLPQLPIFEEIAQPTRETLTTYVLEWAPVTANPLQAPRAAGFFDGKMPELSSKTGNVCKPPEYSYDYYDKATGTVRDNVTWWDRTARMNVYHSLLFEGDRFDLDTRTVGAQAEDDWFNIACGYHALAKLRLTRNTIHTAPGGWKNVQTALKMLSADYCGNGKAFTADGTPLVWRDRALGDFAQQPKELEARWDQNGATCLNTPRLERNFPQWGVDRAAIESDCQSTGHLLPNCDPQVPVTQWESNELVISGHL